MAFVITQNCCNDASCVPVCPVNCIHPTPDEPGYATAEMLHIDPDACIDCGACLEACPVRAIESDFDLSEDAQPFVELNALYYRDPQNQGYSPSPAKRIAPRQDWPEQGTLKVAIVGTGPAACYLADELLAQRGRDILLDMFERLPVPGGLVRFGVAPDHQATKLVADGMARTMANPRVRVFLDVEIGTDLNHSDLAERYNAVVYATGAMSDRRLSIPGEGLPGAHSATDFVAWYNGHPDFVDQSFDFSAERAVVIGNGNVALDVARILLSDIDTLRGTDIAEHAMDALVNSKVREVLIVGRRGPAQAAFSTPELLGLAQTEGVDLRVESDDLTWCEQSMKWGEDDPHSIPRYKAHLISETASRVSTGGRRAVLRFALSPTEMTGKGRVESVRFIRNNLQFENGHVVARPASDELEIPTGLVFWSVGFHGRGVAGIPFDEKRGVYPNLAGRVLNSDGGDEPMTGVYTTGWVKRGPSGMIGTNKNCARETANVLIDDWVAGRLAPVARNDDVAELIPEHMDFSAWNRIDKHERSLGTKVSRPRVKLVDRNRMREVSAIDSNEADA